MVLFARWAFAILPMFGGSMAGGIHKRLVLLIRDRRLGDPVFVQLDTLCDGFSFPGGEI